MLQYLSFFSPFPMIDPAYIDGTRKLITPGHSLNHSFKNDIPTPKRTPEDKAKLPSYLKDSDQTWKV